MEHIYYIELIIRNATLEYPMTAAVVFDSAGTLLHTYRVAKDVLKGELLLDVSTTGIACAKEERVLMVVHANSRDIMAENPEKMLSLFFSENSISFGVACTRMVLPTEELRSVLYNDKCARILDLQECISKVWECCRREVLMSMDNGVILNMGQGTIEFAITSGGRPFRGARETIDRLHQMNVATYIASGDRLSKLEKMADYLGIPRDRVYGIATPSIKQKIVEDLSGEYDLVVMVGDAINDLKAMKTADVSILSLQQQADRKPDILRRNADYIIHHVSEVVDIVSGLVDVRSGKSNKK